MTFKELMTTLEQLERLRVDMNKPALVDSQGGFGEVVEIVTSIDSSSDDSYMTVRESLNESPNHEEDF